MQLSYKQGLPDGKAWVKFYKKANYPFNIQFFFSLYNIYYLCFKSHLHYNLILTKECKKHNLLYKINHK